MTPNSVHDLCNLAFFGADGAGKTTLLESLLAASGTINTAGSIEKGSTLSDFDPQEQQMGHSLTTITAHLEWAGNWINILDTPGLPDLAGRALLAMPAVETAAIVVNAANGIESMTRRMMDFAKTKCRMIIINRIDAAEVDLEALFERITEVFGRECLPLNLPTPDRSGVVDCFFAPDTSAAVAFSSVEQARDAIVDQVVELDEDLMAAYLEQGEALTPEQLHAPFEQALREGHLIPVCFTSARTGAGVRELLDILRKLLPDPTEGRRPRFVNGNTNAPVEVVPDADKHVVAHVFQIANDPYRGKLSMFRVHQGTLKANSQLYVGDARKPFRVAHLFRLQGKELVEADIAIPGDICAVARVEEIYPNAVLHDSPDDSSLMRVHPPYPQPVYSLALITRKHGDEQKLADALARLNEEDLCLDTGFDTQTRQPIVLGLGQMHLRIVLEQLKQRWNLEVDTATPSIGYRETIQSQAEARYRHKKQSGGSGQFGEVMLRVEALPRGRGIELGNEVKGGTIPTQFLPAVEKGVHQALAEGALAGYPVQDVRIVLMDGKAHAVDSNEVSFVIAGRAATLEALLAARPQLLEPLLQVNIGFADEKFGEVSGEISGRRGRLTSTDSPGNGRTEIVTIIPLAEMDGLEARLKAICAGESEFSFEAAGFEPAPADVQQRLARAFKERQPAA